jgi:hypothetical protein
LLDRKNAKGIFDSHIHRRLKRVGERGPFRETCWDCGVRLQNAVVARAAPGNWNDPRDLERPTIEFLKYKIYQ